MRWDRTAIKYPLCATGLAGLFCRWRSQRFSCWSWVAALVPSMCVHRFKARQPTRSFHKPAANGSDAFRTAQPKDGTTRGKWWEVFNDPQLNELEEKASSSNQEIAAAADNFLAARALVREARSQYFPTVSANPSIVNSRPIPGQFGGLQAGSSSGAGLTVKSFTDYSLPFDASWEPDFWGRIRNTVKANIYAAQASAADLENVRLSVQAELAVDYYELRAQDSLKAAA